MVSRLLYISTWIRSYALSDAQRDTVAGLTVGVMLIPQGMAYAMLAGLPPIYGLYASLLPLLIYPLVGTSRHLAVGINAIDALIVAGGVGLLATPYTPDYITLVLGLGLLVGVVQLLMSFLRFGFLVNLLSRPVITGFTAAAALIIALSQLGDLSGMPLERSSRIHVLIASIVQEAGAIHGPTLMLGSACIVFLMTLARFAPRLPGPLLLVLLTTGASAWIRMEDLGIAVVGAIPAGLPSFSAPSTSVDQLSALIPTAFTLALVQFMSVISLGKVFASRHTYRIRPNRELFAMGLFNTLGSCFRSMPVSGSFSRSALAESAGARSALSNVAAALLVGVTLLFLTPLFYHLPIPALAAIIVIAVLGMLDLKTLRHLLLSKRVDGWIALLTFASTLVLGIHQGVLVGIGASVVAMMYRISRPHIAVLGHLPDSRSFRDIRYYPEAQPIPGILMLRVDASFSFVNADYLQSVIEDSITKKPPRAVLIDGSSINDLDTTAADVLEQIHTSLSTRGIDLYFAGVKSKVQDTLLKTGLRRTIGEDHFFLSPHRAVSHLLQQWGTQDAYLAAVPSGKMPPEASYGANAATDQT